LHLTLLCAEQLDSCLRLPETRRRSTRLLSDCLHYRSKNQLPVKGSTIHALSNTRSAIHTLSNTGCAQFILAVSLTLSLSGGNYTGTILENYGVGAPVVGLLIDMGCTIGVGSGSAQCTGSVPGTHPHGFHVVSLQPTECQPAQQLLPTHILLQAAALVNQRAVATDSPLMIEAVSDQCTAMRNRQSLHRPRTALLSTCTSLQHSKL